jgi:hypothetical protein
MLNDCYSSLRAWNYGNESAAVVRNVEFLLSDPFRDFSRHEQGHGRSEVQ